MPIKSPLFLLASTLPVVLIFVPSTAALTLQSTWWTSSSDPSKCVVRSLRKDWEVALADYEKGTGQRAFHRRRYHWLQGG
jgi:hypothetical protein